VEQLLGKSSPDPQAGKVFYLVEAADAETAHTVDREAHGLVGDEFRRG
jgi:hypothetical protein